MSVRTFLRRFSEATGQAPGDWLVAKRVSEAQRDALQGTGEYGGRGDGLGFWQP